MADPFQNPFTSGKPAIPFSLQFFQPNRGPAADAPGKPAFAAPVFAVIDDFQTKVIDLNLDGIPDISHGQSVAAQITGRIPHAQILPINVQTGVHDIPTLLANGQIKSDETHDKTVKIHRLQQENLQDILARLEKRLQEKDLKNKQPLDGVNLSMGSPDNIEITHIDGFSAVTGLPLTPQNLSEHRSDMVDRLEEIAATRILPGPLAPDPQKEFYASFTGAIRRIEGLTKKGVPVYISAGNRPDEITPYSLANGATVVGANDPSGAPIQAFANHALVNRYAQGRYPTRLVIEPVMGEPRLMGLDITGDGKPDVPATEISRQNPEQALNNRNNPEGFGTPAILDGTSLAAPAAMAEDWIRRHPPPKAK